MDLDSFLYGKKEEKNGVYSLKHKVVDPQAQFAATAWMNVSISNPYFNWLYRLSHKRRLVEYFVGQQERQFACFQN
jgi:hypothetical protein